MKILFFGTPQFAATCLKELTQSQNVEILGVFTQPDKAFGRHQQPLKSEVKNLAEELNLKLFQPKNKAELTKMCGQFQADFFVVIAYGMILPPEVLKMPKYGCVNIHASLLPKYRGASPIQEALRQGDTETGISIMEMDEQLDHGDIYLIKRVPIDEGDNYISLANRLAEISSKLLPHTLEDIQSGLLKKIPQNEKHQKPTYCHKIEKKDGEIKSEQTAKQIIDVLKAYTPWPGVFTNFHGKRVKITEASLEKQTISQFPPQTFILDQGQLKLTTKEGIIIPQRLQLEGKKETTAKEFVNGNINKLEKI